MHLRRMVLSGHEEQADTGTCCSSQSTRHSQAGALPAMGSLHFARSELGVKSTGQRGGTHKPAGPETAAHSYGASAAASAVGRTAG
jgi:hypothetical protein